MRFVCLMDWQRIVTAPLDRDLELAVIDDDGTHALIFPCQRTETGWLKSGTGQEIYVRPTHWRDWRDD